MIPEMDRPQRFNDILDVAGSDPEALLLAARQIHDGDEELAGDLRLAALLRGVMPDKSEVDSARLRIGQMLTREVLADPANSDARHMPFRPLRLSEPPDFEPQVVDRQDGARAASLPTSRGAAVARFIRMPWRQMLVRGGVAAALLLALTAGLSFAAAGSLPESPLYGLKRGEETLLLALPLDENSHARALTMVAMRRLQEAEAEAQEHQDAKATALLAEYNSDVVQLITLAATIQAHNEDATAVTDQISQIVQAQTVVVNSATTLGDTAFTNALTVSVATIQTTLKQQHVVVPGMGGQNTGKGHQVQPGPTPTPSPTPSPAPTGTPAPTPTPGGSHGHGHGHNAATSH